MIKRYILHIEFHWGYCPRISIKRAPRHGDRVVDGGVLGTLQRCPTCQEGFLHEPDPDLIMTSVTETDRGLEVRLRRPGRSNHESPLAMDLNAPMPSDVMEAPRNATMSGDIPPVKVGMVPGPEGDLTELLLRKGSLKYVVGETVWFNQEWHEVVVFEEDKRVVLRRPKALSEYKRKLRRGDVE